MKKENTNELLFMEMLVIYLVQYFEIPAEQAFHFVIDFMNKLDKVGIKIKNNIARRN